MYTMYIFAKIWARACLGYFWWYEVLDLYSLLLKDTVLACFYVLMFHKLCYYVFSVGVYGYVRGDHVISIPVSIV